MNSPAPFLPSTIVYELFKSCGIIATHVLIWMTNLATRDLLHKSASETLPRSPGPWIERAVLASTAAPLLESMSMTDRPPMPFDFRVERHPARRYLTNQPETQIEVAAINGHMWGSGSVTIALAIRRKLN